MSLASLEKTLESKIATIASSEDPAHDLLHFKRVVRTAKHLCAQEGADAYVVVPAAWLHDFVIVPKNDPRRSQASRLSAAAAVEYLHTLGIESLNYEAIGHAIEAHSFSAQIEPRTVEAKIVQDADRLDGLGAIGIARCFATAGLLKRAFYNEVDPLAERRLPNDQEYTVDHFYQKLFKTAETLRTAAGRAEGQRRVQVMRDYLTHLDFEISPISRILSP